MRRTTRGSSRPPRSPTNRASPEAATARAGRPRASQVSTARERGAADGDGTFLGALAEDAEHAAVPVDVVGVEPAELGDPDAGRVEDLEQRDVAQPDGPAVLVGHRDRVAQQLGGLGLAEGGGQPAVRAGRTERGRGVVREPPGLLGPPEEAVHGRRTTLQRRARPAGRLLGGEPAAQVAQVRVGEVEHAASGQVGQQAEQVGAVRPQGVRGQAPPQPQLAQVVLERRGEGGRERLGLPSASPPRSPLDVHPVTVGAPDAAGKAPPRARGPRRGTAGRVRPKPIAASRPDRAARDGSSSAATASTRGRRAGGGHRAARAGPGRRRRRPVRRYVTVGHEPLPSPTWVVPHPHRPWLVSVSEAAPSMLVCTRLEEDGSLRVLGRRVTGRRRSAATSR